MATVNYRTLGDNDLVALSRKDSEAFGELASRYSGRLLGLAVHLLGSREEALDAAQEALLHGWTHRERYMGTGSFGAWMRKILLNECLTRLRRRTVPRVSLEGLAGEGGAAIEVPDLSYNPEIVVEHRLRNLEISAAFAKLPEIYRTPLYLAVHDSLSYEEIAKRMGIPVGTVKSRINTARKLVRGMVRGD